MDYKENTERKDKKDITTKILIVIVSLLLVAVVVLGVLLSKTSKEREQYIEENIVVTDERDKIKSEFSNLLDEYEDLESTNDTLNAQIAERKQEIVRLIEELDKTKNWAVGMKKKYEEELTTLRKIMKHYVYQIDSLNSLNLQLTAENEMVKAENDRYKSENNELADMNTDLLTTIEDASKISAARIMVTFLNKRDKEAKKASRIEKLKVTFLLTANKLAESGKKTVYLRIKRPDGYVISSGKQIQVDGQAISYTDSREITYENQDLEVAIYHKVEEEPTIGKYAVSLYMDGYLIGESSFIIEK